MFAGTVVVDGAPEYACVHPVCGAVEDGEVDDVADFPELIVEIRSEISDEFCACKLANCCDANDIACEEPVDVLDDPPPPPPADDGTIDCAGRLVTPALV